MPYYCTNPSCDYVVDSELPSQFLFHHGAQMRYETANAELNHPPFQSIEALLTEYPIPQSDEAVTAQFTDPTLYSTEDLFSERPIPELDNAVTVQPTCPPDQFNEALLAQWPIPEWDNDNTDSSIPTLLAQLYSIVQDINFQRLVRENSPNDEALFAQTLKTIVDNIGFSSAQKRLQIRAFIAGMICTRRNGDGQIKKCIFSIGYLKIDGKHPIDWFLTGDDMETGNAIRIILASQFTTAIELLTRLKPGTTVSYLEWYLDYSKHQQQLFMFVIKSVLTYTTSSTIKLLIKADSNGMAHIMSYLCEANRLQIIARDHPLVTAVMHILRSKSTYLVNALCKPFPGDTPEVLQLPALLMVIIKLHNQQNHQKLTEIIHLLLRLGSPSHIMLALSIQVNPVESSGLIIKNLSLPDNKTSPDLNFKNSLIFAALVQDKRLYFNAIDAFASYPEYVFPRFIITNFFNYLLTVSEDIWQQFFQVAPVTTANSATRYVPLPQAYEKVKSLLNERFGTPSWAGKTHAALVSWLKTGEVKIKKYLATPIVMPKVISCLDKTICLFCNVIYDNGVLHSSVAEQFFQVSYKACPICNTLSMKPLPAQPADTAAKQTTASSSAHQQSVAHKRKSENPVPENLKKPAFNPPQDPSIPCIPVTPVVSPSAVILDEIVEPTVKAPKASASFQPITSTDSSSKAPTVRYCRMCPPGTLAAANGVVCIKHQMNPVRLWCPSCNVNEVEYYGLLCNNCAKRQLLARYPNARILPASGAENNCLIDSLLQLLYPRMSEENRQYNCWDVRIQLRHSGKASRDSFLQVDEHADSIFKIILKKLYPLYRFHIIIYSAHRSIEAHEYFVGDPQIKTVRCLRLWFNCSHFEPITGIEGNGIFPESNTVASSAGSIAFTPSSGHAPSAQSQISSQVTTHSTPTTPVIASSVSPALAVLNKVDTPSSRTLASPNFQPATPTDDIFIGPTIRYCRLCPSETLADVNYLADNVCTFHKTNPISVRCPSCKVSEVKRHGLFCNRCAKAKFTDQYPQARIGQASGLEHNCLIDSLIQIVRPDVLEPARVAMSSDIRSKLINAGKTRHLDFLQVDKHAPFILQIIFGKEYDRYRFNIITYSAHQPIDANHHSINFSDRERSTRYLRLWFNNSHFEPITGIEGAEIISQRIPHGSSSAGISAITPTTA